MRNSKALASILLMVSASAMATASIFEKSPNNPSGNLWHGLGGPSGAYVFANSFEITGGDNVVTGLGTWLNMESPGFPGSLVSLQIWGDNGGPNPFNVLTTTAKFRTPTVGNNLYQVPTLTSPVLAYNTKYWFAAKVDYADQLLTDGTHHGFGAYAFSTHVQNSQQNDNGEFWFTDEIDGVTFPNYGQDWTPEIAFQVQLTSTPEPAPLAVLGLGIFAVLRRKRAKK
jgi:hypothetical protein